MTTGPIGNKTFSQRALIAIAIAAAVIALAAFVLAVSSGLLVLFICVVLAVVLDAIARLISRYTRVGHKPALGITIALMLFGIILALGTGGVGVFEEMPNLSSQLDRSVAQVNDSLLRIGWVRGIAGDAKPATSIISMGKHALGDLSNVATLTLGAFADLFVVFVVGIYLAWSPKVYVSAAVGLFPIHHRDRIHEVLNASAHALRRWILGQLAAMIMVFVFISAGLLLLGVNMALALGAIAGLLTFVPYLGGIVAAVPAILIGFLDSPLQAGYVTALFLASYTIEGYFFTPLVQQRTVSIAPAFLLIAQLLAAQFSGLAGVFVAAPLTVVLTVMVQMLYMQDLLGDKPHVLGADSAPDPDPDPDPSPDPDDDDDAAAIEDDTAAATRAPPALPQTQ